MGQTNETEQPIVRFSGAWWTYIIARAGFLRTIVNSVEDSLAVSGRFLLMSYLFYLGAQVGALLIAPNFSWPLQMEMAMFIIQIAGLEGSIPGLARQAETLRTEKKDEKQATKVEHVMLSARIMTICAFVEGAAYALKIDHQILQVCSAILMIARGFVITGFLIELAKIEKKAPLIISKKAHQQVQAEKRAQLDRDHERERAEHAREMARLAQPVMPDERVQDLIQKALANLAVQFDQRLETLIQEQTQALSDQQGTTNDLSHRFEQTVNWWKVEQQRLLASIQEVREIQQTLQAAGSAPSKDEIFNAVWSRVQTLFAEQQSARQTRQSAPTTNSPANRAAITNTHRRSEGKQSVPTENDESGKRPKRIDPAEVDAVVHPLLDKDGALTHRKIAAMPGVPYTETVVYASVKRWREAQPGEKRTSDESEVS